MNSDIKTTRANQSDIIELSKISLQNGGQLLLRVASDSMWPMLDVGDELVVILSIPDYIQRGDLIVYQANSELITHRVIGVRWDYILTKGDHWMKIDRPICFHDILGIVQAKVRGEHPVDFRVLRWQRLNRLIGWLQAHWLIFEDHGINGLDKIIRLEFQTIVLWFERLLLFIWGYR